MEPNYQKIAANLSNEIAKDVYTIAVLEDALASKNEIINDQKLKHPEDFPADESNKKQGEKTNG